MLELTAIDLDELAAALADQEAFEHVWLIDPRTGALVLWSRDTGIDGQNPIDFDDLDPQLVVVDPLPSRVWFGDMADFAGAVSDQRVALSLARALDGKGVFRRFRDVIHRQGPELLTAWSTYRDVRARRRAVEWLRDERLVDDRAARAHRTAHPDPAVP